MTVAACNSRDSAATAPPGSRPLAPVSRSAALDILLPAGNPGVGCGLRICPDSEDATRSEGPVSTDDALASHRSGAGEGSGPLAIHGPSEVGMPAVLSDAWLTGARMAHLGPGVSLAGVM